MLHLGQIIFKNKLTDWLSKEKNRYKTGKDIFHKINFTKEEFKTLFEKNGFEVEKSLCC